VKGLARGVPIVTRQLWSDRVEKGREKRAGAYAISQPVRTLTKSRAHTFRRRRQVLMEKHHRLSNNATMM